MQSEPTTQAPGASGRALGAWEVESKDPTADPEWDRQVAAHPKATVFHTAAWARVLIATYGHRPNYLRISHPDGSVILLPMMEVRSWLTGKRGVCLPFSDECGPLVRGSFDAAEVVRLLSRMAQERGWKHFEVRGGPALADAPDGEQPNFYAHTLELRRPETAIFERFDSSVRRAIRKAERSGMTIRVEQQFPAIEDYYHLHVQTRKKHGLPPQPFSFFRNVYRELIEKGMGFVVVARRETKPVAAAIFLQLGKEAIYKFGASDETQQEHRGSNLVMWQGIRHLIQSGAEGLGFGRTSVTNRGLRRFKGSWGATERPLHYFRRTTSGGRWSAGTDKTEGRHKAVFRRMPLMANRLLGALLYRHLD